MARQPIKYAGTEVDAARTVSEIVGLVVKYGGERTSIEWQDGQPTAVSFAIRHPTIGLVPVVLRARTDNVYEILLRKAPWSLQRRCTRAEYGKKLREQALRIIWRHLKDLIEQQLLAVEIGQYDLTDVFLHGIPFELPDGSCGTLGEYIARGALAAHDGALFLPSGQRKD